MKSRRYKIFLKSCSVKPSELERKQRVKVNGNYKLIESEKLYRMRSERMASVYDYKTERPRMAFCFSEKDLSIHLARIQKVIDEKIAMIKEKENKVIMEQMLNV